MLPEAARYPRLFSGARLHLDLLVALLMAGIVYVILWKTTLDEPFPVLSFVGLPTMPVWGLSDMGLIDLATIIDIIIE